MSKVTALLKDGRPVEEIGEGDEAEVIVAETPFYGEIGGQVGDTGVIDEQTACHLRCDGYEATPRQSHRPCRQTHRAESSGRGIRSDLQVFDEDRRATEANHSGTHLLQAALKTVLGEHVKQSGSLVNAERLRFDFTHFSRIEEEELARIEELRPTG